MYIIIRTEEERFLPVTFPGIRPDTYMVSNYGNIYCITTGKYKNLTPSKTRNYVIGKFKMSDGSKKTIGIHRIVAWEFCDGYTEERCIVNHKNSEENDNYFENLEWVTFSENNFHRFAHGRGGTNPPVYKGEDHPQSIYNLETVKDICRLLEENKSIIDIMRYFGFRGQNDNKKFYNLIYDIKRHKTWAEISSLYSF